MLLAVPSGCLINPESCEMQLTRRKDRVKSLWRKVSVSECVCVRERERERERGGGGGGGGGGGERGETYKM